MLGVGAEEQVYVLQDVGAVQGGRVNGCWRGVSFKGRPEGVRSRGLPFPLVPLELR